MVPESRPSPRQAQPQALVGRPTAPPPRSAHSHCPGDDHTATDTDAGADGPPRRAPQPPRDARGRERWRARPRDPHWRATDAPGPGAGRHRPCGAAGVCWARSGLCWALAVPARGGAAGQSRRAGSPNPSPAPASPTSPQWATAPSSPAGPVRPAPGARALPLGATTRRPPRAPFCACGSFCLCSLRLLRVASQRARRRPRRA
jgi:hypothetical protein